MKVNRNWLLPVVWLASVLLLSGVSPSLLAQQARKPNLDREAFSYLLNAPAPTTPAPCSPNHSLNKRPSSE
jgi:hypothetical protein